MNAENVHENWGKNSLSDELLVWVINLIPQYVALAQIWKLHMKILLLLHKRKWKNWN